MNRRTLLCALPAAALVAAALGAASASAQDYPTKPIRLIVPFAPGGATTQLARLFSEGLEKEIGQPIIIVNQPGGGGSVGAAAAARARADGYTLLMGSDANMGSRPQIADSGYTHNSFEPIARLAGTPVGIAVKTDGPYKTLKDLVSAAKAKELKFTTPGVGSGPHLHGEVFIDDQAMKALHIASKSGGDALVKLLSGEVDFVSVAASNFPSMIKQNEGIIRVLAISTDGRWSFLKDVPSFKEQGFAFTPSLWWGIFVPKGTPAPILAKLRSAVEKAAKNPETAALYARFYFDPAYLDHDAFAKVIEADVATKRRALAKIGLLKK